MMAAMIWVAFGWFIIAGAIVNAADSVVSLTIGRHKPEMRESGARASAWQSLLSSGLLLSVGVSTATRWAPRGALKWLLGIAAGFLLISLIRSSPAARRRRSRTSRHSAAK
jgi:Na+-driven multidrug efflux pump